ncbi:Zinc/iron permease [Lentinus brumalis]|uniref:Zinc/iron permease n=1 Tax=Lentinus brumalis TaxID=2498619 RepID=A0A371CZL7_9APHY|nr:Zinc/iron permease [Polyporus brumalis]
MFAVEEDGTVERVLIMLLIFAVSLSAVSFPTITATFRSIRVPSILFFIGKHFGTGVILSTAFVHLLQDSFKALLNPMVNERWKVGHWAGMIVVVTTLMRRCSPSTLLLILSPHRLCSLLCIFLVEYVSTAFVDRLQSYPSAPPTPTASVVSSSASSVRMVFDDTTETRPSILVETPSGTPTWLEGLPRGDRPADLFDEAGHPSGAPLPLAPPELAQESSQPSKSARTDETVPLTNSPVPTSSQFYGSTSQRSSNRPPARPIHQLAHVSAPPDAFFSGGHHRHEPRDSHASHHARVSRWRWFPWGDWGSEASSNTVVDRPGPASHSHTHSHPHADAPLPPPCRPLPQPVKNNGGKNGENGHSRSSRGHHHGHAHADMERWMHGIDGEDHASGHGHGHGQMHDESVDEECATDPGEAAETKVGRRRQVIGILVLQLGIMIHSLVIGLTLSITSGSEFTSLVIAIVFHQLFEGLSLGIRIAGLPTSDSEHGVHILPGRTLKPLLASTFAITTPLGIGIGLATLGGVKSKGPNLILVQGVMSAISAGMLIYAACVEMLAGDFVMDAHLWRSSIRRQALALGSLFAGVIAMAAIGCVSSLVGMHAIC